MLLIPNVLERFLCLLEWESLTDDRFDVMRVNCLVHILELQPATHHEASDRAHVGQGVKCARLLLTRLTTNKPDHTDDTLHFDRLHALLHRIGTTDLDNVVDAFSVRGQLLGRLTPVRSRLIIDGVLCAKLLLEVFALLVGAARCDDYGTSSEGELDCCDADTAGTLSENALAWLQSLGFKTVEGVPGCDRCTGQGSGLIRC